MLLLAMLTGCASAPAAAADLSDKDVADIKASIDRWRTDFVDNKRDDLANIISADMVLMPPNGQPVTGKDAAMTYMKAYPTITKFDAAADEVTGHGDLAYARGTYSINLTLPDKTAAHEQGSFTEVHRKQADGSWLYTRLIWHSNDPVAAAPAAKK
jgi:ketosteroid isomerase-like protein